jgi:uncharacterized protein (TIGR00369 family)
MREVNNPYNGLDGYLCFGCCPDNEFGLRLKFIENGDYLESEWEPSLYFQGYKNVLHGGIQASLFDEIAGWVVSVKLGSSGVTSHLVVKYKKPARVDEGKLKLKARIIKFEKRIATVEAELISSKGISCAEAVIEYYVLPEEKAKRDFYYPGREKF